MNLLHFGLVVLGLTPLIATLLLGYQVMRAGNGVLGKPSISAPLFYVNKLLVAILFAVQAAACVFPSFFLHLPFLIQDSVADVQKLLALIFLLSGNLLLLPAYYSMSIFTRVGIPSGEHALVTDGVYKISRNPMYASFLFFFAACFLLAPSLLLAVLITFNLVVHHFIILKEERFLTDYFGQQYLNYKSNVARYL